MFNIIAVFLLSIYSWFFKKEFVGTRDEAYTKFDIKLELHKLKQNEKTID